VNGFTFPVRDSHALATLMASLADNEAQWKTVNASIEQPWTDADMLAAYATIWDEFRDTRNRTLRADAGPSRPPERTPAAKSREPAEWAASPIERRPGSKKSSQIFRSAGPNAGRSMA
jgi:hypothetical protein